MFSPVVLKNNVKNNNNSMNIIVCEEVTCENELVKYY